MMSLAGVRGCYMDLFFPTRFKRVCLLRNDDRCIRSRYRPLMLLVGAGFSSSCFRGNTTSTLTIRHCIVVSQHWVMSAKGLNGRSDAHTVDAVNEALVCQQTKVDLNKRCWHLMR